MQLFAITLFITATFGAALLKRDNLSAKNLVTISPATASCGDTSAGAECRTAGQAVQNILGSFFMFRISDFNTQAALVAVMLYESGNFKYSKNHYPGVPGQGTRNMQSPEYNAKYASYLSTIPNSGISPSAFTTAQAQGPAAVLALVNTDLWSFSSAAWFLTTQCSQEVRNGLAQGTQAGWSNYLTQCIGTPATNDRTQVWDKVRSLGKWST
ncbi:hypothetical protein AMS68_003629 [Peltaster fructicola]|uniref:Uncharacterized protein n=1 Tax=Peltaster fructicola TaxID=286661 RepID=A0A6H0XTL1_9PEZI|nr:hypothetical protein AMS68_003629 [Peltaster fructicola]